MYKIASINNANRKTKTASNLLIAERYRKSPQKKKLC